MKMKIAIVLSLIIVACVVYAKDRGPGEMFEPTPCGGYRCSNESCSSMEDEKASIKELTFSFYDEGPSYKIVMDQESFKTSMNKDSNFYLSQNYSASITSELRGIIEKYMRESGLLKFNGWRVEINGLPMTRDAYIRITFENGKNFYMSFNGCRAPSGFYEAAQKFIDKIIPICGYDPEKCEKTPPYVNPFAGTHKFVYEGKDGKKQTFIYTMTCGRTDTVELKTFGDYYSSQHVKCVGHKIHGGKEKYSFTIESYYDDSELKPSKKGNGAAEIYRKNEQLFLVPYQICPEFPERSEIPEENE